jgi:transmembrane sensor
MGSDAKGACRLRVRFGTSPAGDCRLKIRDVLTDDPTPVELDSVGARSTMTRATDIEQRASEWIIRSEGGNFTEDMRAELERWLQNPRNRVIFLRLEEAWRRASRIRGARPLDGNVDPDLLKTPDLTLGPDDTNSGWGSGWPLRVAAGAAITLILYLLGLEAWIVLGHSDWISYTTSVGGYEHVTLADGSAIQLNTDSEIRARLTAGKREVELVRGEALIKVAHDAHRRFTVTAANTSVRADPPGIVGAAFALRMRGPKDIDVAVTEGTILLGPSNRIIDVVLGRNASSHSTLGAGDAATVRPEGVHLAKVALEELNRKLSWTAGLLSFQGETLAEVTDEFNRYNRKHLIVTDPLIAGRRIGGAFQATDPESFVSALQKWFEIRADEEVLADAANPVIRLSRTN